MKHVLLAARGMEQVPPTLSVGVLQCVGLLATSRMHCNDPEPVAARSAGRAGTGSNVGVSG